MADFFINIPSSGSPSWKDPVDTAASLPASGNNIGDAKIAKDTQTIYVWDGTNWISVATPGAAIALDGLIGDVLATGPGVAPATVAFVGGVSAANVASGANLANAATSSNTPNTIVKRDGSGNFSTQQIILGANPTTSLQTASKQYVDNFPAVNGLQNTGYSLSPVYGSISNTVTEGNDARLSVQNLVRVKQNPGAGEFSSVAAALASITTASSSNPFVIDIGPGIFPEPQLQMKPNVGIRGVSSSATILFAITANQSFILGSDSSNINNVTITGANGINGVGIYHQGTAGTGVSVDSCVITNCTTLVSCFGSTAVPSSILLENSYGIGPFTTGILVTNTGSNYTSALLNNFVFDTAGSTAAADFAKAAGSNTFLTINNSLLIQTSGTGNGFNISDGNTFTSLACTIQGVSKALWVQNVGSAPVLTVTSLSLSSNVNDVVIDHTTASGTVQGNFRADLSSISSNLIDLFFTDPIDGITFTGDLTFGPSFNSRTNVTNLILEGPTMGLYTGGELSSGGGFLIDITSGTGYFSTGIPTSFFSWSATSITLSASTTNYIYFNSSGSLVANSNFPDTQGVILLGRVVTNSVGIEFIDDSPLDASHYGNLNDNFVRNALGSVYQFGSIVSENATPKHLNVTSGSYYFGNNNFLPSAGTNITFDTFYRNGSGGQVIGSTNVVDTSNYDNGSGTLQAIPANQYVRHTLYLVGEGSNQKYLFVYGQTVFATLTQAENGNIPTPPSYFIDGVVLIASLIVKQGATSIVAGGGEIIDNRPRIGFSLPAVSSVGTVSSVALSLPGSVFGVSGSPITSSGTLTGTFNTQTANTIFAGPTSGGASAPTFRSLGSADIPLISLTAGVSGILPIANGGTGSASQNFVDLTTNQSIAGNKTFSNQLQASQSFISGTASLTDAANIATNAALANRFTVTLGGNRNLSAPTNPTDGQKVVWIFTQDGTGNRTLTFDAIFDFGNMPTLILSNVAGKRDYMGAIYNSAGTKWDVVAYSNAF